MCNIIMERKSTLAADLKRQDSGYNDTYSVFITLSDRQMSYDKMKCMGEYAMTGEREIWRRRNMFCHECGIKTADDAMFCHNCGTKVADTDAVQQESIVTRENPDSVQMVISIDKAAGKAYSKFTFPVFVDGNLMGDLANGQTAAYMISPGQHLVKIGGFIIGIDVPAGDASVELDFHWGGNSKPEIVCHQGQWVSKPCERERVSAGDELKSMNKAGLACLVIGVAGFFMGCILMPSSSGGIVSAERHSADLAQMDIALPLFIGGLLLWMIGGVIIGLSSRKKK